MIRMPTPLDSVAKFAAPAFGRPRPPAVATRPVALGQTWDQMMGLPGWVGDSVRLMVHGSTGAIGIYLGTSSDSRFWSALGWVVGVMSGFAALLDICSIIGRIFGIEE